MSKRIDELWGQALDQAMPNTYSSLSWTQIEKIKSVFAELIVRECAVIATDCNSDMTAAEVLKHFGVEE